MQQKLHPGRRISIRQVLVGQPSHGAGEGLRVARCFQGVPVCFNLAPAGPGVAQGHGYYPEDGHGHQKEGQGSRVGQAAIAKGGDAPAHHLIGQPEAEEGDGRLDEDAQGDVFVDVMAQLVSQDGFDFIVAE